MKLLLQTLVALFMGLQAQAAVLQAASNLQNNKVIVLVEDPTRRVFMEVDAKTGRKEALGFPNDLVSEDIMAVISLPDYVVVVSQWTSGDGKKPRVHEYVRSSKIWMAAGELSCLSFDQIEIEKTELRVQCADADNNKTVKMALDFTSKVMVKMKLPLEQDKQSGASFALTGGSKFKWESLELSLGKKKKVYTSQDLSLSSDAKTFKTIKKTETYGPKESN